MTKDKEREKLFESSNLIGYSCRYGGEEAIELADSWLYNQSVFITKEAAPLLAAQLLAFSNGGISLD